MTDVELWGHYLTPHRVFGWCGVCDGRTWEQELTAWRIWADKPDAALMQALVEFFNENDETLRRLRD